MPFCQSCGNELGEDDLFCEQCGASLKKIDVRETKETLKSPTKMLVILGISIVVLSGIFAVYSSTTRSAATELTPSPSSAATELYEATPLTPSTTKAVTSELEPATPKGGDAKKARFYYSGYVYRIYVSDTAGFLAIEESGTWIIFEKFNVFRSGGMYKFRLQGNSEYNTLQLSKSGKALLSFGSEELSGTWNLVTLKEMEDAKQHLVGLGIPNSLQYSAELSKLSTPLNETTSRDSARR